MADHAAALAAIAAIVANTAEGKALIAKRESLEEQRAAAKVEAEQLRFAGAWSRNWMRRRRGRWTWGAAGRELEEVRGQCLSLVDKLKMMLPRGALVGVRPLGSGVSTWSGGRGTRGSCQVES